MDPVVELSRSGCETLEFHVSEINPQTVANAFQLDPKTVWLKQEFGRRCYFPDQNGQFSLGQEVGECVLALTVEGAPPQHTTQTIPCSTSTIPSPSSTPHYKPINTKKDGTFNVKVVKANMKKLPNGKVEFEQLEQTHINLDDSSANINTVTNAVQAKWGPEYVVVTGDGLAVDNSSGTQGKFWRAPSRKFFAVVKERVGKGKGKKRPQIVIDTSSESDDFMPSFSMKKMRQLGTASSSYTHTSQLSLIREDVQALREDMKCLFSIDRRMKIPTALYRQLADTFQCNICRHAPITPPVIFARCCKSIVGCQTCVDEWYRGDSGITKSCPLCGTERALPETMRLHGIDNFLKAIKPIISEPEVNQGENL